MDRVGTFYSEATPAIGIPMPPPIPLPGPIQIPNTAHETVFDEDHFRPLGPSFDVDGGAARAVAAYDRDGDGAIDLRQRGRFGRSETTRYDDAGRHSIAKLAREADRRGNGDGKATAAEIAQVMSGFDGWTFGLDKRGPIPDGRLGGAERDRFLQAWGEKSSYYPWAYAPPGSPRDEPPTMLLPKPFPSPLPWKPFDRTDFSSVSELTRGEDLPRSTATNVAAG